MRSLLSKRAYEEELPRIRLNAVWYVEADESYDVSKRTADDCRYVAVRTLTGSGSMHLRSGKEYCLDANTIGLFKERQIARYKTNGSEWQFYWFEFSAENWNSSMLNDIAVVPCSKQDRVEMERCFTSLNRGTSQSCRVAESLFNYLLADWQMRACDEKQDEQMQQVLDLMEKGRRESMSIPDMAQSRYVRKELPHSGERGDGVLSKGIYDPGRDGCGNGAFAYYGHDDCGDRFLSGLCPAELLQQGVQKALWNIPAACAR